jgi:uncharacterized protein (TIGR04222 family)
VIALAIYSLKRAGALEMQAGGSLTRLAGEAQPENPLESRVWLDVVPGATLAGLLASPALRASIEGRCSFYRSKLEREGLLTTADDKQRATMAAIVAGAALGALAAYKILVALAYGHKNVGFLFLEAGVALFLLFLSAQHVRRSSANARGKAYLEQFSTAFSGPPRGLGADRGIGAGVALALVGAVGFAALEGTADEAFAREFKKNGGGSDGGGGCSSGDGGGGGGCGGCGGGGD